MVKTMVFQVVMFGCESWTIKKTEHQRIDEFELWCWKSLLRNLYAGQEETVRTGHGTRDWLRIGKGVCHPAYLTYMQSKS